MTAVPAAPYPPASTKKPSVFKMPKADKTTKKSASSAPLPAHWMVFLAFVATVGFCLFASLFANMQQASSPAPVPSSYPAQSPAQSPPTMSPFDHPRHGPPPLEDNNEYDDVGKFEFEDDVGKFEFEDRHPRRHEGSSSSYRPPPPTGDYHHHDGSDRRQERHHRRHDDYHERHHRRHDDYHPQRPPQDTFHPPYDNEQRHKQRRKGDTTSTSKQQTLGFFQAIIWGVFAFAAFAWLTTKQTEMEKAKNGKDGDVKTRSRSRSRSAKRKQPSTSTTTDSPTRKAKVSFSAETPATPATKSGFRATPTPHPSRKPPSDSGRGPFNSPPSVSDAASAALPTTPPKKKKATKSPSKKLTPEKRREIHARMEARTAAAMEYRDRVRSPGSANMAQPPSSTDNKTRLKEVRDRVRAKWQK